MICDIEVTGEGKDRFDFLSKKFGKRAALETFLQEDGTSSVDGFISDVEQANRVNAITFSTIEGLVQDAGGITVLDLNSDSLSSESVTKAISKTKDRFEKILEDSLNVENMTEQQKYVASRAYVTLENFEDLIPKIKDRLKVFGLTVTEINQDLETSYENEVSESTDKEHIYNVSHLERNRLDSVKPSVKMFLATLAEKRYDEDGNIVDSVDDLGMRMPVDFHSLYSLLSKNLADRYTMDEMQETLEILAEDIPSVDDVLNYIESGTFNSTENTVHNNVKLDSFRNAFFNSFANTYNQSITLTTESVRTEEGTSKTKSSILYTDKRRSDRTLKQKWATSAFKILHQPKQVKNTLWNDLVFDKFNPYEKLDAKDRKQAKTERNKKLNSKINKSILLEISDNLRTLGINVEPKALNVLRKQLNRNNPTGFSDFVNKDLAFLAEQMYKNNVNIFKEEGSIINKLADIQSKISSDLGVSAYMNGEGNQVYPINLPTTVSEMFHEFQNGKERFDDFMQDPFYNKFKILNDFNTKDNKMEIAMFDTITNNDSGIATPYDTLDPVSSISSRMLAFMNFNPKGKASRSHAWVMVPTPADRSNTQVVKMKTLKEGLFPYRMDNLFSEETNFKDWVLDMAQSEFERIKIVRNEFDSNSDKSTLVNNYHVVGNELGNGGYFNYFPELNQFIKVDEAGVVENIDFNSFEVQNALKEGVENQFKADIEYLESVGFINPLGINQDGTKRYSDFSLTEQSKNILPKGSFTDSNLFSFLAHNIIANHELSALFYGDLAYFNSIKDAETGARTASFENANKRSGLAFTPGQKLNIGQGGAKQSFNVAFVNDVVTSTDPNIHSYYESVLGKQQASKYNKTDSTDGQGLTSLDRYADILNGMGSLTPALSTTINELKKPVDKINWNKVTEPLIPIKGFLHSNRFDENFGRVMPKSLKYSLLPVIPSAIKDNPTMQEIHRKMENPSNKIDEVVFSTGSKIGAYNTNNLNDVADSFNSVEMSNMDWRLPQVVPYKDKTQENFGSQIRKLIEGNVSDTAMYGEKTGAQVKQEYQQAISNKIENSFKKLVQEISEKGSLSIRKVARKVLDDVNNNAYKSTSDFLNKALEVIETADGQLDTRIPMSFPAIKHKVESSLNSMVRKAITKQELPGFNGVVYSALGFNKEAIQVDRILKPVRLGENGNTLPAEIKVSPQYFTNKLREQLRGEQDPKTRKTINEVLGQMKRGEFDISSMPKSLLQGVIYRIPTQGKNSMLPIEIVGFTPEALSTTVVLPAEVVTQSGMDYDIDKVYVELKHFTHSAESGFSVIESDLTTDNGIDNHIINTHYDILTSPHHAKELLMPNHTDTLETLKSDIASIYENNTLGQKWSSLSIQDSFRDKNQAGGVFIGIASNANTAHALFQNLDVQLRSKGEQVSETSQGVKINGEYVNSLSQTTNREKGLISDDHVEIQTAAVDNASNPLLGTLNINTITGSTYLFLVEAGLGLKYPTYLVNSPVVRELVRMTRINEANMGPDGAFQTALSDLAEQRGYDLSDINDVDHDVSINVLESAMDQAREGNETTSYDLEILKAFLTFRQYGNDMTFVQNALRTDVKGPSQTLAGNIVQANQLAKVQGTYSNENYSKVSKNDDLSPIETVILNRDKYKNHSIEMYEKLGLHGAIDLVSSFVADSTPVFQKALKDFQKGLGGVLVESDVRLLMNDFYTFLMANQEAHAEGKKSILAESDSSTVAKLLMGETSVGKKVVEAQKYDLSLAREDINHIPNQFLQSLTVELGHRTTGFDLVNFNNTIARVLTSDQKSMLTNEFLDLLTHENSFLSNLGLELFAYNFFTEGFSRGVNSFSEFIPIEMYEHYTDGQGGPNLVNYFRDIYKDFGDINSFNGDEFFTRFLRNRGSQLKGLKNLTKRKPAQIKDFLKSNPKVNYFLTNSGGNVSIGMRVPESKQNYVNIGNLLGHKNILVEYQTGESLSDIRTTQDAFENAKRSEDVIENKDSKCITS